MGRPRLTDAEREERRRVRSAFSFSDASYQHYDPRQEGYGSTDEWMAAADALAGGRGILKNTTKPKGNPDLNLLNLDAMPADIGALKRAFRNTLFLVHPDFAGGSNEACRAVLAAFDRLLRFY